MRPLERFVTIAVCALCFAGCSTVAPSAEGVEVRFIIYSVSVAPDGTRRTETYENAVLAASGERFERQVGPRYRISLASHIEGESARVQFGAFDLLRQVRAGETDTVVPFGGQSDVGLESTSTHQYRVLLKAAKRDLPRPAV